MVHEGSVREFLRASLLVGVLTCASGCSPPPELTPTEEDLTRRCLALANQQETSAECEQVTEPMEKAFLAKHPDFYEGLLAERKKFVEERIAEDMRRRDELNACLDDREAGNRKSTSCEKFRPHEIASAREDRRRTGCASAQLDGKADAAKSCQGLSAAEIEEEVQMERNRRERRR